MQKDVDYDLIIVGAGVAGTAAALSASETATEMGKDNLKALIVEKSSQDDWGGNSRYTTANLRLIDEDHLYPTFEEDIIDDSNGRADRKYVRRLSIEALDTVRWIRAKGVKLEKRVNRWTNASIPTIGPVGGGLEIITKLLDNARRNNSVSILFQSLVYKMSLGDDDGSPTKLSIRDASGKTRILTCHATILAGGGFEGNDEMLTKYLGKQACMIRKDVPATKVHSGECISMALGLGAMPSGQFDGYHGGVVDARNYDGYRPLVNSYPYGILVNKSGHRFIDEGMGEVNDSFEIIARAIFDQPDHVAYLILDQKLYKIPDYKNDIKTNLSPIEARTIEELAEKCGLPPDGLRATVEEFNNTATKSADPASPIPLNSSTKTLSPAKSHWASKLDESPFVCYPVEGTIQFTYGGIATDDKGRVIDTNNTPILGLYAAGEMVGLSYSRYTAATSVLRSLTYGRIAGFEAVGWILEERKK